MSAAKHTPGPWTVIPVRVTPCDHYQDAASIRDADFNRVATLFCEEGAHPDSAARSANARLIAETPALYEAAKKAVGCTVGHGPCDECRRLLQAAIARVEGGDA